MTYLLAQASAHRIPLRDETVQTCVTSPPYWGLRAYVGEQAFTWGGEDHEHEWGAQRIKSVQPQMDSNGGIGNKGTRGQDSWTAGAASSMSQGAHCPCGAWYGALGLEPTPELYVEHMVEVFREIHRVLRRDGTLWLNLGDSYAANGTTGGGSPVDTRTDGRKSYEGDKVRGREPEMRRARDIGLKPKDLVGIPWRVAFALQQPYYTGRIKAETDRAWLAALMDGEGTFTILSTTSPHGSGNSYPPISQVRMTSSSVIAKAASLVGVASPAQYPPSASGNRAVYQWRLAGRRAADVAAEVYPFLVEKRKQALIAWNHQAVRESYTTKRGVRIPQEALAKQLLCRDLIRQLNRGEHVEIPSWMSEPSLWEPGWYLRSDVVWAKPNPMPESVTDRPTKSHEYLFLLSKSPRYFYDAEAVREASITGDPRRPYTSEGAWQLDGRAEDQRKGGQRREGDDFTGRNARSVWSIATQPYPGAHFATFPEELPERCIKAGSSKQACGVCGAPWERVTALEGGVTTGRTAAQAAGRDARGIGRASFPVGALNEVTSTHRTMGFQPTCTHEDGSGTSVVFDPFNGSGTTGAVALRLGRRYVGLDLSREYLSEQALHRIDPLAGAAQDARTGASGQQVMAL